MPKVKVINFDYKNSTPATHKRKVKNNRVPYGAVAGGNGTYVIKGDPPKVLIDLEPKDGDIYYRIDIYRDLKALLDRRISKKYATKVCQSMLGQEVTVERDAFGQLKISELKNYL